MKQISKNALLFGALALLISTVPVQAMEQAPADVQKEVAIKRNFFSKWSDKAKSMRLEALMKELNKHWKQFMKCVKNDEGCPKSLVWTIRGILATIIALVAIKGVKAGVGLGYAGARGYAEKYPRSKVGEGMKFIEEAAVDAPELTEFLEERVPVIEKATEKFKEITKTTPGYKLLD